MSHESPLKSLHAEAAAALARELNERGGAKAVGDVGGPLQFIACGPDESGPLYEVVGTYGQVQLEYAAIRKGAAVFDDAGRGTLAITGGERIDFLNRMVTQELKGLESGGARETFWLNRKGRIVADLTLVELCASDPPPGPLPGREGESSSSGDVMLGCVERQSAPAAARSLDEFIFVDDVAVHDVSDEWHHIGVHGPRTLELLSQASGADVVLHEHDVATLTIGGVECIVTPRNLTGGPGVDVISKRDDAGAVWSRLVERGGAMGERPGRVRPVGWFALNCARIEAGVPLFNVDFSEANLPAESGLLDERVSFTKGCYLGQEVVSRLYHLGKPKRIVTGFEMTDDAMPVAGAKVYAADESGEGPGEIEIGTVSSSAPSPLKGLAAIGLAMVRGKEAAPGTAVFIEADGEARPARLCALEHLPAAAAKAVTT